MHLHSRADESYTNSAENVQEFIVQPNETLPNNQRQECIKEPFDQMRMEHSQLFVSIINVAVAV